MPTPEQLEIRGMAREFAAGELRPHSAAWDAARELPADLFSRMAEMGFLGMRIPEEYGGLGLDLTTYLLALEALAWGDASAALGVSVHGGPVVDALLHAGTPEQQARFLPELASGERLGAYALSEPEAGSDATALACRARQDGDGWVLDGEKKWITNGDRCGLLVVFARTSGEPGDRDGISAFLVPRETPGIEITGRERTMGMSGSETVRLSFRDVRV